MPHKNREQALECKRRYYYNHRQEALDRMRLYYASNREKIHAYNREYRKAHREDFRLYQIEYRKTHPDNRKRGDYNYFLRLEKVRGLTRKQYDTLFSSQNGVCAICQQQSPTKLHVDHNHKTGVIRGLLCSRCNTGLGMIERVGAGTIVSYLEKSDVDRYQEGLARKN